MFDAQAHRRIDKLEKQLESHLNHITKLESAIVSNTSSLEELVELFKGAKAFRRFFLFVTPIFAGIYGVWQWIWGK